MAGQKKRARPPSKTEVDLEKARLKWGVLRALIWLIGVPAIVASFWVPLQPVLTMVEALAGRDTNVGLSATITVGLTLGLVGAGFAAIYKLRAQRKELERQRERIIDLEGELSERKE